MGIRGHLRPEHETEHKKKDSEGIAPFVHSVTLTQIWSAVVFLPFAMQ